MPRQYKRKSLRATSYTQEDLQTAIERVKREELSNYAASKIYGIPTSTLNDHVKGKRGLLSQTLGRSPVIPIELENKLASGLRVLEKWGWGLSRTEVLDITEQFIKANNIKTPFKNDRPGPDWFISFRKRQKLSIKKPQSLEYIRKKMTDPFVIDEYFTFLKQTLLELEITDPHKIWNLDETSVCLDPTKTKVVGGIGAPCTRTTKGTGKDNITVLTTVSAAGTKLSPLIIFKGKYMYEEWMSVNQKEKYDFEISYAVSKRGWIETAIFYDYMQKIIIPGLGEERPVLMIYDGHSTHVDEKVVELAVKHNITILKLPAHTSHLLQPLDLAVFKSFKTRWDKKLVDWQRQNVGVKLRKQVFAEMFAETWHAVNSDIIKSGFRKGGIYLFNANIIPEEKYDPATLKRWKTKSKKKLTQKLELKTLKFMCVEVINANMFSNTFVSTYQRGVDSSNDNLGQIQPVYNTSFEELLLKKVSQHSQNTGNKNSTKLTRVAKGSEVITRTYLEKQKNGESSSSKEMSASQPNDNEKAGPFNISKKKLRNKKSKIEETSDETKISITEKGKGIGKKTRSGNKSLIVTANDVKSIKTENGKDISKKTRTGNKSLIVTANDVKSIKTENGKGISKKTRTGNKSLIVTANDVKSIKTENGKGISKKTRTGNKSLIVKTNDLKSIKTECFSKKCVPKKQKVKSNKPSLKNLSKRTKRSISVNTTSESGEISTHSDSDIFDVLSESFSEIDIDNEEEITVQTVLETNKRVKELPTNGKINDMQTNQSGNEFQTDERMEELQINGRMGELHTDHRVNEFQTDERVEESQIESNKGDIDVNNVTIGKELNSKVYTKRELNISTKQTKEPKNPALKLPSHSSSKIHHNKREKVTVLSSVRYKPENIAFSGEKTCVSLQLKNIDLNFDLSQHKRRHLKDDTADKENKKQRLNDCINSKQETNDAENKNVIKDRMILIKTEKNNEMLNKDKLLYETEIYNIGDTVLTRYYTKSWKYYVGVIKYFNSETKKYSVCYYKSIGKENNVKFVVPKRKDEDCVPEDSIVKQIELLQIKEDLEEYTLMNDEDAIYF